MRRWILGIIATFFLSIIGCGETDSSHRAAHGNAQRTFLDDYIAAQDLPPPATPIDISGTWSGLLYCAGRDFPIDINIDTSNDAPAATVTIAPMIGKESVATPFYRKHLNVPMEVTYASDTNLLAFVETREPGAKPRTDRRLGMRALVDPKTKNQALLYIAEINGTRVARTCDFGVVGKNQGAEPLAFMVQTLGGLYGRRRPIQAGICPPAYEAWINAALALPQPTPRQPDYSAALSDKVFIPAFGKAYKDMEADALKEAGSVLLGACSQFSSDKKQAKQTYKQVYAAVSYLTNHRYYQSVRHTQLRTAITSNWTRWVSSEIGRGAALDRRDLATAASAPRIFALTALNAGADAEFSKALLSYSQTLEDSNRMLEFVRSIEDVKDDFKALIAKQQIAAQRTDLDGDIAAEALDYYLVPAAHQLSANAADLQNAVYMASWAATVSTANVCPAATLATCEAAQKIFAKASAKAAKVAAQSLEDDIDELYAERTLPALALSLAEEQSLRRDFGILFDNDAFEDMRDRLRDKRRKVQKSLRGELITLAKNTPTAPALNAIKADYFLADDLAQSAMAKVAKTLDAQLEQTSPFEGLYAADYFNALYNKDFTTLRRLDDYYLERMRPLMDFGTQQLVIMGPLLDAISGSPESTTSNNIQRGVANLSALYAVLGTYLIEYQDVYKACLERNAVTFRITKRTDLVTTDGFGNEIKRTPGWTTADDYRINREFKQNFQSLFGTASGTGTEQLFDLFLNDGRITQMRSAMQQLMARYACQSRDVQQLEAGMIAYDRDVIRRMRGR